MSVNILNFTLFNVRKLTMIFSGNRTKGSLDKSVLTEFIKNNLLIGKL